MTIGVLALQGDFARHAAALARCGVPSVEVRKPAELDDVDGLIMPGDESTTLLTLLRAWDFGPAIEAFHAAGRPLFGTCAGLIFLAREVEHPRQPPSVSSISGSSETPTDGSASPSRPRPTWSSGTARGHSA